MARSHWAKSKKSDGQTQNMTILAKGNNFYDLLENIFHQLLAFII